MLHRVALSALTLAAVSGCAQVASEAPSSVVREVGDVFITANLNPAGQATGISGTVRVIDLPGTDDSQVQLVARGLPPGGHAWHIHSGTCVQPGGIVVAFTPAGQMPGLDDPVNAETDGEAEESATVPAATLSEAQLTGESYALNIHTNPAMPPGPPIACADL